MLKFLRPFFTEMYGKADQQLIWFECIFLQEELQKFCKLVLIKLNLMRRQSQKKFPGQLSVIQDFTVKQKS